ncbi:MAG TPA: hypothetical protein VIL97_04695, partial [Thermoanaerobaculia bacterium]
EHLVMQYPPGISLLDVLPYVAAEAIDAMAPGTMSVSIPPVGPISRATFLAVAAIVALRNLAVIVGLLLIHRALTQLGVRERVANLAIVLSFFGSPLVFYSLVGMTHAVSFLIASGILVSLLDRAPRARGLAVGVATLIRYGSIALAAPVLMHTRRAAAGIAAPLVLLPFWWRWTTGSWMPPDYGGSFEATIAAPFRILVSPHHGLFLFHPAMALGLVGLVVASRTARVARVGLVWFVAVAAFHGSWSEWANEGGYGQRFMIDAVPPLAYGLAVFLETLSAWRVAIAAFLAAFGFALFVFAVAGFARGPGDLRWPQTFADYRPVLADAPSPREWIEGLRRASFVL